MDERESSTACSCCGRDHAADLHTDRDAARAALAHACREARIADVLVLASHVDLLEARAWLGARGYSPRACIELDRARRRRAA